MSCSVYVKRLNFNQADSGRHKKIWNSKVFEGETLKNFSQGIDFVVISLEKTTTTDWWFNFNTGPI